MKVLVLGASLKEDRYSNKAVKLLLAHNHEVIAVGNQDGEIEGVKIHRDHPLFENVHTVTLYLNALRQKEYVDYILALKPKRVIFNPGAENQELATILSANGIFYEEACTLVLLRTNQFN